MKKILFALLLACALSPSLRAQQDTALTNRLEKMLHLTQLSDLDKILDYTYPKVFNYATRAQMKEQLKSALESDEFTTTLDSVTLKTIFPVFTINTGQYAKISHTMIMRMKFKTVFDSSEAAQFIELMSPEFGKENIRFNKATNTFNVSMLSYLVAIKDSFSKEWTFLNYDEESKLISLLLSKEVVEKLKAYH